MLPRGQLDSAAPVYRYFKKLGIILRVMTSDSIPRRMVDPHSNPVIPRPLEPSALLSEVQSVLSELLVVHHSHIFSRGGYNGG